MENKSFTYNLICTEDFTRYYLPIILGYSFEIIIIISVTVIGLLLVIYKKKKVNRNFN